jgi:peptidoglycan/xylan/chitin deacetylase (PgdA/CDA1 family)
MRYDSLPQNLNISLFGKPQERTVALTFNNGPDKYTSSILDVLKKYGVQATFFLRGENIQQYPEIVQREYDEGHIIGHHTLFQADSTGNVSEN